MQAAKIKIFKPHKADEVKLVAHCPKCGRKLIRTAGCKPTEVQCFPCKQNYLVTMTDGEIKLTATESKPSDFTKRGAQGIQPEDGKHSAFCTKCGRKLLRTEFCKPAEVTCTPCRLNYIVTVADGTVDTVPEITEREQAFFAVK